MALAGAAGVGEKLHHVYPLDPMAYNDQGLIYQKLEQYEAAIDSIQQAIALKPDYWEAYLNLAGIQQTLKQFEAALINIDKAIALQPSHAIAYNSRGIMLHELERNQDAIASYNNAIALKPDYEQAYFNRGLVYQDLIEYLDALASFEQVIAINPNHTEAFINAGRALQVLRQMEISLAFLDRAIELNPESALAYTCRGMALKHLKRFDEAYESYNAAIELQPDFAEAYCRRGNLNQSLQKLDAAIMDYETAIMLNPEYPNANWNKALLKILTGQYEEGWQLFEWRWQDNLKRFYRNYSQPLWLGDQDLQDKTLLIIPEQGFGDIIQFCRYIPMLEKQAAKVIFEVVEELTPLMSSLGGNYTLLKSGDTNLDFDAYCPVMSLPLAFKTTLATIPAAVPYLHVSEEKQSLWQARLGEKTAFRVGLAWSGSKGHNEDHNRSMPLNQLAGLFNLPVEFYCLQKQIRDEDQQDLLNYPLKTYFDELNDFADTAALIEAMDLVISVDTSVVHLAGALARPVWVLLAYAPDYRWMLDRSDSPWYPTASLYRQPAPDDWQSVIDNVLVDLSVKITE